MRKIRRMLFYASASIYMGCNPGLRVLPKVTPAMKLPKARVITRSKPPPEKIIAKKSKKKEAEVQVGPEKKPIEKKCDEACKRKGEIYINFYASVAEGEVKEVKKMLKNRLISLKDKSVNVMSLLSAIKHPRMLRLFLKQGVDINSTNKDGETALMDAAFEGNYHKARDLIRNGADVKIKNTKANTSAISYCTSGKLARLLIKKGADVNEKNIYSTTPLIYASSRGCNDVAKVLLENGADVNANSPVVGTALILASSTGNVEMVKLLLSKGADVKVLGTDYFDKKKTKKTALQIAKENNNTEVIKILESYGVKN